MGHPKQLKVRDLAALVQEVKERYPKNWMDIPVYIGDDEEMNGIHTAWYHDVIGTTDDGNDKTFRELISEGNNVELPDKQPAVLIS